MNPKAKGYLLGAVAAATYGMNPLFTLPLYDHGMYPDSVLFFRYLFALPVLALMLVLRGFGFAVRPREAGSLAVYGVLFAVSSLTLFESYRYMDAGIVLIIAAVSWVIASGSMSTYFLRIRKLFPRLLHIGHR